MPWVILFPVLLLCSLAANSRWVLLDGRVLSGLFRRPAVLLMLWLPSLGMAGLWWQAGAAFRVNLLLGAAVMGAVGASCLLIYGRLVGRVGWVVSQGGMKKKQGRKKSPGRKGPAPPLANS
jgi:hypothetical protein